VPVFIHNLKGYDAHHIMTAADVLGPDVKLDAMAKNTEKFTTLSVNHIVFDQGLNELHALVRG
jgi:hypothetical protein